MAKKYYARPVNKTSNKGKAIFSKIALLVLIIAAALISYPQGYNNLAKSINNKVPLALPLLSENPFKLGLDLQGGTQLIYRADLSNIQGISETEAMQGVRDVIERRVNALGVSEPLIQITKEGNEQRLIVELAGISNVNEAIQKIGETPLLEFKKENPQPKRELTADEQKKITEDNAKLKQEAGLTLTEVLQNPAEFEKNVTDNSQDSAAIITAKGSLGTIEKAGAYPNIYSALANYNDGSIVSNLVEDDAGYSIVRLDKKTSVDEVTANHILICFKGAERCPEDKQITKDEALAKIMELKNIVSPSNFAELAKKNSTEPGADTSGGDLGTFKRGMMVKEFDEAVFAAKVGEIVGPIETQFGYHLIYKRDQASVPAYEASRVFYKKITKDDIVEPEPYINTGLNGSHLKRATIQFQGQTNDPVVALEFDKEGSEMFATLTRENLKKTIAIYLDGQLLSAPTVQTEILDGKAIITGRFTVEETKILARRLNSGALPVPVEMISQQTIGPTLGADSLNMSMKAGVLGMILVVIFMVLLYRIPGLISSLTLVIYGVLILAFFKLIGVTMTLAGIAGLILSIGMAVDVNVLIFARFKEELAEGKPYNSAMDEAFKRAWPSIRDGHLSTLITALILMQFSTSFIKGFALTLAIGVILSLFTAMVIVRILLRMITSRKIVEKFPFLFLNKKKPEAPKL